MQLYVQVSNMKMKNISSCNNGYGLFKITYGVKRVKCLMQLDKPTLYIITVAEHVNVYNIVCIVDT